MPPVRDTRFEAPSPHPEENSRQRGSAGDKPASLRVPTDWKGLNRLVGLGTHGTSITNLALEDVQLPDSPWRWLVAALPQLHALQHLSLAGCLIGDANVTAMLGVVCRSISNGGITPEALTAQAAQSNRRATVSEIASTSLLHLRSLNLRRNNLTDTSAAVVGRFALWNAANLRVLDVSHNDFTDHGVDVLCVYLSKVAPLRVPGIEPHFHTKPHSPTPPPSQHDLRALDTAAHAVTKLVRPDAVEVVRNVLLSIYPQALSLNKKGPYNSIMSANKNAVANVSSSVGLQALVLTGNLTSVEGLVSILRWATRSHVDMVLGGRSRVRTLSSPAAHVSGGGGGPPMGFTRALQDLPATCKWRYADLSGLSMVGGSVGVDGARQLLLSVLFCSPKIQVLDISDNHGAGDIFARLLFEMGSQAAISGRRPPRCLSSLKAINLSNTGLSDDGAQVLMHALLDFDLTPQHGPDVGVLIHIEAIDFTRNDSTLSRKGLRNLTRFFEEQEVPVQVGPLSAAYVVHPAPLDVPTPPNSAATLHLRTRQQIPFHLPQPTTTSNHNLSFEGTPRPTAPSPTPSHNHPKVLPDSYHPFQTPTSIQNLSAVMQQQSSNHHHSLAGGGGSAQSSMVLYPPSNGVHGSPDATTTTINNNSYVAPNNHYTSHEPRSPSVDVGVQATPLLDAPPIETLTITNTPSPSRLPRRSSAATNPEATTTTSPSKPVVWRQKSEEVIESKSPYRSWPPEGAPSRENSLVVEASANASTHQPPVELGGPLEDSTNNKPEEADMSLVIASCDDGAGEEDEDNRELQFSNSDIMATTEATTKHSGSGEGTTTMTLDTSELNIVEDGVTIVAPQSTEEEATPTPDSKRQINRSDVSHNTTNDKDMPDTEEAVPVDAEEIVDFNDDEEVEVSAHGDDEAIKEDIHQEDAAKSAAVVIRSSGDSVTPKWRQPGVIPLVPLYNAPRKNPNDLKGKIKVFNFTYSHAPGHLLGLLWHALHADVHAPQLWNRLVSNAELKPRLLKILTRCKALELNGSGLNEDATTPTPLSEEEARTYFIDALVARSEGLKQAIVSDVSRFMQPMMEDDPTTPDDTKSTSGITLSTDELMGSCTFTVSSNERRNAVSGRLQEGANGPYQAPTTDPSGSTIGTPFSFLGVAPVDDVLQGMIDGNVSSFESWPALCHYAALCVLPPQFGKDGDTSAAAHLYASPISQADVLFTALLRHETIKGAEAGDHQLIGSRFPTTAHVVHEYQGREDELLEELPSSVVDATLRRYLDVTESLLPTNTSDNNTNTDADNKDAEVDEEEGGGEGGDEDAEDELASNGVVSVVGDDDEECRGASPTHDAVLVSDSSLNSEEFDKKMDEVFNSTADEFAITDADASPSGPAWRRKVNKVAIQTLVDDAVAEDAIKKTEGADKEEDALSSTIAPHEDIVLDAIENGSHRTSPEGSVVTTAHRHPEMSPPLEPFRRVVSETPRRSSVDDQPVEEEDVSESDALPFESLLQKRHEEAAQASDTPRRRSVSFADGGQSPTAYLTSPYVDPPATHSSKTSQSSSVSGASHNEGTSDAALRIKRLKAMQRLCYDAMNIGYIALDEKSRKKLRVCQCKLAKDSSKHEVSVSIEWGEFLVLKRYRGGLSGKEVMLIHPLVSGLTIQKGAVGSKELVLVMEQLHGPEEVNVQTGLKGGPKLDPAVERRVVSPARHISTPNEGGHTPSTSASNRLHSASNRRVINVTLILPSDNGCDKTVNLLQQAVNAAHDTFERNIGAAFAKRLAEAEKAESNPPIQKRPLPSVGGGGVRPQPLVPSALGGAH